MNSIDWKSATKFIVYQAYGGDDLLYVGYSGIGLSRPFDCRHPIHRWGTTKLVWYAFENETDARDYEHKLIRQLQPLYNRRQQRSPLDHPENITRLTPRQRAVWDMYFEQNLSEREIAIKTGRTKSAIHTAIRSIRRILNGLRADGTGLLGGKRGRPKKNVP